MLKEKERQMVLDYLYQECIACSQDSLESRRKMTCKLESKLKYERMPEKERVVVYRTIVNKKIAEYLINKAPKSLYINLEERSAEKIKLSLEQLAEGVCKSMKKNEKIAICEKLGIEYI